MEITFLSNEEKPISISFFLKKQGFSSTNLRKLKNEAIFFINNKNIPFYSLIHKGDKLKIEYHFTNNILPQKLDVNIVFEDEHLLALNKPSGVLVHPTVQENKNTMANFLSYYMNDRKDFDGIHFVSRLDKNTSGIILVAKTSRIKNLLSKTKIKKEYLAIIENKLPSDTGIINLPIARKEESIIEREVNIKGKNACTFYEVLEKSENYSVVKFQIKTGRTHQIRVHTSFLNCPIINDGIYGYSLNKNSPFLLHALKISFIHPLTKNKIIITAPIPDNFDSFYKPKKSNN